MITTLDSDRLDAVLGRLVADVGATAAAANIVIGNRLGLYQALAVGPATPAELATRTGTAERYVREWMRGQASGGSIDRDERPDRYSMALEQAFAFAEVRDAGFTRFRRAAQTPFDLVYEVRP